MKKRLTCLLFAICCILSMMPNVWAANNIIYEGGLSFNGYTFGKEHYMSTNGSIYDYPNGYKIGGSSIGRAYRVAVHAIPQNGGFLSGYASLSNGQKIPVYWDEEGTVEVEANIEGGIAYAYILPAMLTASTRNMTFTITIVEYKDVSLRQRLNTDSLTATFAVDVDGPVSNISINNSTGKISVTTDDYLVGVKSVQYTVNNGATLHDYTAPITITDDINYITVRATDNLDNVAVMRSGNVSHSGTSDVGAASMYPSSYYYRTPMFHHWLINTGKSN